MNGMPRAPVISLRLPGHVHLQLLALDHAGSGDQEERLVEPDVESAELHAVRDSRWRVGMDSDTDEHG